MYNFRYHLVTIVSIFAALAIGLLLGVAIAGSELAKGTASDMTSSLMEQFDELNASNRNLSEQLAQEEALRAQLFGGWQSGRLEGRTVAILSTNSEADQILGRSLGALVSGSGGVPVLLSIDQDLGFGTADDELAAKLNALLPPVEGEDYSFTLARALSNEWTFQFAASSVGPTVSNSDSVSFDNPALSENANLAEGDSDSSGGSIMVTEDPSQASAVERAFVANYPLTAQLIELGCLTVKADYGPMLTALAELPRLSTPRAQAQSEAYQLAQDQQLPYACNGLIDTVPLSSTNTSLQAGRVSLNLATIFNQKGIEGVLPFMGLQSDQDVMLSKNASHEIVGNYYVMLTQNSDQANTLIDAAYEYGLSCIVSPLGPAGRYSVIALLSGAESGVYGLGRDGVAAQPSYPNDRKGSAAFSLATP